MYSLSELRNLYLSSNEIEFIRGLETLQNLEILDLSDNDIQEVKGLESLISLSSLWLKNNPINEKLLKDLGGLDTSGYANDPRKFVTYCIINL